MNNSLSFNNAKIMKVLFLFLMIPFFSCTNKNVVKSNVFFEIQNNILSKKNILLFKIVNNSSKDYFVCFDTLSIYNNGELNYEINNCVHPRPVFYINNDSIESNPYFEMIKSKTIDTVEINCLKKKKMLSINYIKDFKKLKKIIILRKKSALLLKLPFDNTYIRCNKEYTYLPQNGEYKVQFKYKMNKTFFEKTFDKQEIARLKHENIDPYFNEIVSNKVPLVLK